MPFFGNTFSPKKTPPRKSASLSSLHTLDRSTREKELGLELEPPVLNIGGQSWKFEDGQWLAESGGNAPTRKMHRLIKKLEEENNYLKLKIEVLMDMLTETTVEFHMMEKAVEDVKAQHRRKN